MKRMITLIAMVLMFSGCYTQLHPGRYVTNVDERAIICNEWGYQCYATRIRPGTAYLYEHVYRPHSHKRYQKVYKVKSKPKATQRKHRRSERTHGRRDIQRGTQTRRNTRGTRTRINTKRSTAQKSRPPRGRNGVKRKTRTNQ